MARPTAKVQLLGFGDAGPLRLGAQEAEAIPEASGKRPSDALWC